MQFGRLAVTIAVAAVLGAAGFTMPAAAGTGSTAWHARMLSWTSSDAASFRAWNAARLDRGRWNRFDWSTDSCTGAPSRPFGYDFRLSCWRHDFGYRNYGAAGELAQHKDRLDTTFRADMLRVCNRQSVSDRTTCQAIAEIYYQAVRLIGSADVDGAA